MHKKENEIAQKGTDLEVGQNKTAEDNQWASSLNVEGYKHPQEDKDAKDNQWISTNKNI